MGDSGFFSGFKRFLIMISKPINATVNLILLTLVFFVGVAVTSLPAKLFRKNFLDLKLKKKGSYWIPRKKGSDSLEKYYRMF